MQPLEIIVRSALVTLTSAAIVAAGTIPAVTGSHLEAKLETSHASDRRSHWDLGVTNDAADRTPAAATTAEARAVVSDFFDSLNARRYGRTCLLLSREYYRRHRVRSARYCAASLRVALTWSQSVDFRLIHVAVHRHGAVVDADVNGDPGRIELVAERGRLRVLRLVGDR